MTVVELDAYLRARAVEAVAAGRVVRLSADPATGYAYGMGSWKPGYGPDGVEPNYPVR